MHYSLKNILSADDLNYLIDYYNSKEHFVTHGMEKLDMPFNDKEFIAVIDNILQNKIGIKEKYKIIGDNYYKHTHSYFPHCDAVNENAWLNIVVPLQQYQVFGDQKFIVFNQTWLGPTITWMGKIQLDGEFVNNKKTNQRPADGEFFRNGTDKELPDDIWQHLNEEYFDKEYLYSMNGVAYDWCPHDVIVFESQHIHATGKMQSTEKLGLSIRIEKI
jgi:hypothetical protein